jgi:hypothetical protein
MSAKPGSVSATLYGITHSNRSDDDLWGKNQFNSTFPTALACYMRDKGAKPVFLETVLSPKGEIEIKATESKEWNEIFNTQKANTDLGFFFESPYKPYEKYIHKELETLENIDLVIKDGGKFLRPLEVKLTVLPDQSTCSKSNECHWGSELVIRPASTSYAALGIFDSLPQERRAEARSIIEPTAIKVSDWGTEAAIMKHKKEILDTLDSFFKIFMPYQQPFLMQPVWKTVGKSPQLADQAFDIFIWSDYSLCRTFIDRARNEKEGQHVSRYLRSCARLLRCLNDLCTTRKVAIRRIYREMALGNQTDKEFALSGRVTCDYMTCGRLETPKIAVTALKEIILHGGESKLSPERRFDATIFFTAKHLFHTL